MVNEVQTHALTTGADSAHRFISTPQKCLIVSSVFLRARREDIPEGLIREYRARWSIFMAVMRGLARASIQRQRSVAKKIDCRVMPGNDELGTLRLPSPLFQFRRRRLIEHIALGALQQIEFVGFDRQRATLAWQLGDLLDARETVLQTRRRSVGPCLVDI
jgi:hypothetical protein